MSFAVYPRLGAIVFGSEAAATKVSTSPHLFSPPLLPSSSPLLLPLLFSPPLAPSSPLTVSPHTSPALLPT